MHAPMPVSMSSTALVRALATAVLATAFVLALVAPQPAEAARVKCNGTFRVLHDDRIGALKLPKGNYRIVTLSRGMPSCSESAALFTSFLEDFDGKLPGGWRVVPANSSFVRSAGVGFHVARVGGGGGGETEGGESENGGSGRYPYTGSRCSAPFRVLHNDRIGPLRLPAGRYAIVLLQQRGLTCAQSSKLFTRFLSAYNGVLPAPWTLEEQTASFRRGASGPGFRVEPYS